MCAKEVGSDFLRNFRKPHSQKGPSKRRGTPQLRPVADGGGLPAISITVVVVRSLSLSQVATDCFRLMAIFVPQVQLLSCLVIVESRSLSKH